MVVDILRVLERMSNAESFDSRMASGKDGIYPAQRLAVQKFRALEYDK
jgi:hypothetical protein